MGLDLKLIGREYPRLQQFFVQTIRDGTVIGISAGHGRGGKQKVESNEDSGRVYVDDDADLYLLADGYLGGGAAEYCTSRFPELVGRDVSPEGLRSGVLSLEQELQGISDDRSMATFVAARRVGDHLNYALVGDSFLYVADGGIRNISAENQFPRMRLGYRVASDPDVDPLEDASHVHAGSIDLADGATVLLATDGIAERKGGPTIEQLRQLLGASDLGEGMEELFRTIFRSPTGYSDNILVIAHRHSAV